MKILIIDDNAAVRLSLKKVLENEFGDVVTIGDPRLIPALLRSGDTDAVLLDMNFDVGNLDGKEGIFWLQRIKECSPSPAVVMITAFGDVPLAVEAMKLGAEDFVTKPWDNDELISKLRNAIMKSRLHNKEKQSVEKASEIGAKELRRSEMTLEEIKLEHVNEVLERLDGNLSAAAKQLGINRQTLYNILKKK